MACTHIRKSKIINLKSRSWLDDGVLPGLITIIRTCWIWPWLGLLQRALSPGHPAAALSIWLVLLLPLLSFTLARTISIGSAAQTANPGMDHPFSMDERNSLPLFPRLLVGLLGLVAAVLVVWWQLYRGEIGLVNPAWISQMGDSLIHWPETAISPSVLLMITAILLWLRGLLDAGTSFTHDRIWRSFVISLGLMVLFLLIISAVEMDLVQQLVTSVLALMAAGMAALAFSSIKITAGLDRALGFGLRQTSNEVGGELAPLQTNSMPIVNRYWFMSVGGAIGLLMALGILLTLLIAPEVMNAVVDALWAVATFIGDILGMILLAFVYAASVVIFFLYRLLEPWIRRLLERLEVEDELLERFSERPEEADAQPLEVLERAPVPDEYRWLGLAIAGIITLVIFALVIRRLSQSDVETLDEDRESILSAALLQDQLGSLWDRLMGRFRQDPDEPFLPLDGDETRQRIRAVYQQLLATATDMGQPRQPAATPVEYEDRLRKSTASSQDPESETDVLRTFYGEQFAAQLDVITTGYVSARYGDVAPSGEVAAKVEAAWGKIERGIEREVAVEKIVIK